MLPRLAVSAAMALGLASPAFALNIVLSNDDGLTSNLKALYDALKGAGHDVVVSVPCTGQSGRGAGIVMYSTATIEATSDPQVTAKGGCHNGAAPAGAPAVGPFTKAGYTNGDFFYVHGTPVMATLYGLDVAAKNRWGKAPDVVLSGPNEGQNLGAIINSSGTVSNVQAAGARDIPAIALSADGDTTDNTGLANPKSAIVAQLTVKLLDALKAKAGTGPLLPAGVALNVNFPKEIAAGTPFAFSRIGTFNAYGLTFNNAVPYGLGIAMNTGAPTAAQREDESVVYRSKVAVSAMQLGFEHRPAGQEWLRLRLRDLFAE
ncbi:5'/3'-nucleotidase SurE [Pseudorhodoferax sp.]|uniref:5'/3'-nucleotidase SurE n=1 Tax=Pseudorhodoferax sp. TaxID=1993553 RepID=UPI0039E5968A